MRMILYFIFFYYDSPKHIAHYKVNTRIYKKNNDRFGKPLTNKEGITLEGWAQQINLSILGVHPNVWLVMETLKWSNMMKQFNQAITTFSSCAQRRGWWWYEMMSSGRAASGASAASGPRTGVINIKARLRQGGIVTAYYTFERTDKFVYGNNTPYMVRQLIPNYNHSIWIEVCECLSVKLGRY